MKQLLFLPILWCLAMVGCDLDPDCVEMDTLSEFDSLTAVEDFQRLNLRAAYHAFDTLYDDLTFIIKDDSTYQSIKSLSLSGTEPCTDCFFPTIDFSKYTLVGRFIFLACNEGSLATVALNSDSTFTYYQKIYNYEQCDVTVCPNSTFNWVLIPKIDPSSEPIEFKKGKFYYQCNC